MTPEQELQWYKTHERITGCRNTVALLEAGFYLIGREHVTAISNVDDLTYYNDNVSHEYGDRILAQVGRIMREVFGDENVYGLGSDEFEIFYPGPEAQFLELHDQLENRMRNDITEDGNRVSLTVSTGYAVGTSTEPEHEYQMSHMAARFMYEAKREGKMRCIGSAYTEESYKKQDASTSHIYRIDELDPLTGLYNLVAFRERGRKAIRREEAADRDMVVVFFNIINFKRFNEKFGFEEGDELLKSFAKDLQDFFEGELIGRFSEDHFLLVTGRENIEDTIQLLRDCLRRTKKSSILNLNAGVYELKGNERIIEAVDKARIASESIPRHSNECVRFYDEVMNQMLARQKYIVENLDTALSEGYVQVYLQPVIRAMSGELCGAEALARWVDPEYGLMPPFAFIGTLEENHLIHKLDAYIVNEICRMYRERTDRGEEMVPVSFNLSRLDFELCDMVKIVEETVEKYNVPRDMLHVEITESILNEDEQFIRTSTDRLHKLGYQVWMDDFGSGYSSLNVLKEYDFDELKIDMRFMSVFSEKSKKIITSVIDMSKKLGIQTLAEGVETEEQVDFLKSVGCEKLQGYLFSRPEPAEEVFESIREGHFIHEKPETAMYYDDIGKINLIDDHSMALVEYTPHRLKFIYTNHEFSNTLASLGTYSVSDAEHNINDENFPLVRLFNDFAQKLAVSRSAERLNFIDNGNSCTMLGKIVAHKRERFAIQIFLINLSLARDELQGRAIDEVLRMLYTVYDEVYLNNIEEDTGTTLYLAGDPGGESMQRHNLKDVFADYCNEHIHPLDRERYLRFSCVDNIVERLIESGRGFLSGYFRTGEEGNYIWKLHTAIRMTRIDDRCFVMCIRDAAVSGDGVDEMVKDLYKINTL